MFLLAIAATRVMVDAVFDGGVSLAAIREVGVLIGWMYLIVCTGFYTLKLSFRAWARGHPTAADDLQRAWRELLSKPED